MFPRAVSRIISDIASLKIQGATRVAEAGLHAAEILISSGGAARLTALRRSLIATRPTEPCLWNALSAVIAARDKAEAIRTARDHFTISRQRIPGVAVRAIGKARCVFTHCHSSAVVSSIAALHRRSKLQAHCTETRPRFQGRLTASELARHRVPVTLSVDSAMPESIACADAVLLGADALLADGSVYNKVGSSLVAILAERHRRPVYILSDSWKLIGPGYALKVEERDSSEVWGRAPRGVRIRNPAFDRVDASFIKSIITEIGSFPPARAATSIARAYPFLATGQWPSGRQSAS